MKATLSLSDFLPVQAGSMARRAARKQKGSQRNSFMMRLVVEEDAGRDSFEDTANSSRSKCLPAPGIAPWLGGLAARRLLAKEVSEAQRPDVDARGRRREQQGSWPKTEPFCLRFAM